MGYDLRLVTYEDDGCLEELRLADGSSHVTVRRAWPRLAEAWRLVSRT